MAQRGRKTKYDEYVKPYLEDIKRWIRSGATEEQICEALGIAVSSFNLYKGKYVELSEAIHTGRQTVILDLKGALYKRAMGYRYSEARAVMKDGVIVSQERYEKEMPPDTKACEMLIRNYDKQWRDKDAISTDFKRQEMELKKAIAEANNFDLTIKEDRSNE